MTQPIDRPAPRTRGSTPAVLLGALRPRQWTKNLIVFAPLLFARAVFVPGAAQKATLSFAAFCALASGVYVLNDWLDRAQDRLHPEKRHRPIAAGLITLPGAIGLIVVCWGLALGVGLSVGLGFTLAATAYWGLQLAYSWSLKKHVIIDVMAIALGFVLRVVGGGVAIAVPVSNWLFLCTLLLALFVGFAKRRAELSSLGADALAHRQNLSEYTLPMLDQMMAVVSAACIVAYGLYTVSPDTVAHVGSDHLKFTVPFVVYGIFRYLFLIHRRGAGGSPERVLLSDPPLLVGVGLYVVFAVWALYH